MRILVATDAATPQVNGVVRTYERLAANLRSHSVEMSFLVPDDFRTFAFPPYPEIRLAIPDLSRVHRRIDEIAPDFVHVATEGPVGWMMRRACLARSRPFTTSYHTKFPEYASAVLGLPSGWCYAAARYFHGAAAGTMVATPSLATDLARHGFKRLLPWTRGVDTNLFRPRGVRLFGASHPVFLYVGRISREKNIEAFLDADLPGIKVVVGSGPYLPVLQRKYPAVVFTGSKSGEELARHYASADVFVFPSRTDTFGLVLLEAMSSGVPVAAYPVTGPIDLVKDGLTGCLDEDIGTAARKALTLDRRDARIHASTYSWQVTATMFLDNICRAAGQPQMRTALRNSTRGANVKCHASFTRSQ